MQILRNLKNNQHGFTTFELIVAIQLSLLVIGLIYVSLIFATKLANKWQDKVYMENNLSLVSITLSKSLDEVETMYVVETNEFIGLKQNGDSLHIYLGDYVFLNGEMMGDSTLRLTSGRISYLLPAADGSSDLITASNVSGLQLGTIRIIQLERLIF
jgi:type II secretory pathway component PulJ